MTEVATLTLIRQLIAFAVLLQSIELLFMRRWYADDGVWQWSILSREFSFLPAPIQWVLSIFLRYPNFLLVLVARAGIAAYSVVYVNELALWWLFFSTLLIAFRWRGACNGGSDYMTLLVLLAVCVATSAVATPEIVQGCLLYIAIQTLCSYFIAGVVKLRKKSWRSGNALKGFLTSGIYPANEALIKVVSLPISAKLFSWAILLFECSAPLVLLRFEFALIYISMAMLFHISIAYIFGLNRFFFAWLATYPSLLYASDVFGYYAGTY